MPQRECPMCGETMRLQRRESTDRVPGTSEVTRRMTAEWACPDCDYFEEAEPDTDADGHVRKPK